MNENKDKFYNFNPDKKFSLPEGTPVYITTTRQIAFYDKAAQMDGASKIKNIGVVPNEELRRPTNEELQKWANERGVSENELKPIQIASENWSNNI